MLHQLFDDAKQSKPSIIFLDELDALVGWSRHSTTTQKIIRLDGGVLYAVLFVVHIVRMRVGGARHKQ